MADGKGSRQYLIRHRDGSQSGPLTADAIRSLARDGRISSDSLIAEEGTDRWVIASRIRGLLGHDDPGHSAPRATSTHRDVSPASAATPPSIAEGRETASRPLVVSELISDALPTLPLAIAAIGQERQREAKKRRRGTLRLWTALVAVGLVLAIGYGIWYANQDFAGGHGLDSEDTRAGIVAVVLAFLVYILFVILPVGLVVLYRAEKRGVAPIATDLAKVIDSEFSALASARYADHTLARCSNGWLVAYSHMGLIVASVEENWIRTIPGSAIQRVTVDSRQVSSASVTQSGSFAMGIANAPGHYGVASIDSRSETVTAHRYSTVVDVYLSDPDCPHIQLDFGPHELVGKRVYGALASTQASTEAREG